MMWVALVALGNMGVTIWLVRENRRLTQMAMARHAGDFTAMVRAERRPVAAKQEDSGESKHYLPRIPAEGVNP